MSKWMTDEKVDDGQKDKRKMDRNVTECTKKKRNKGMNDA